MVEPNAETYAAVRTWIDPVEAEVRLPELVARRGDLAASAERAGAALEQAEALLSKAVDPGGPIRAVVLVGLSQANGWVTMLDGEPTLFMAVEQLPSAPFDVVLALHELVHLVHMRRVTSDWPPDRLDADLLREGLAVHATTRLMPWVLPSGHLWFRTGAEAWVEGCQAMRAQLHARALTELNRTDVSQTWFSGASDRVGDLPGRCGYWLGWKLLDHLVGDRPLEIPLRWPLIEASTQLRRALSDVVAHGTSPGHLF
jgi:hypothetical protein